MMKGTTTPIILKMTVDSEYHKNKPQGNPMLSDMTPDLLASTQDFEKEWRCTWGRLGDDAQRGDTYCPDIGKILRQAKRSLTMPCDTTLSVVR